MKADLYVYADSFVYNQKDTDIQVLEKLRKFKVLTQKVSNSENVFLFNTKEFSSTQLLADGTLCGDFLLQNKKKNINRDINNVFLNLLTSGIYHTTNFTGNEIDGLIGMHDKDSCSAKVVLEKSHIQNREKQIIGTYQDWLDFRRFFLGLYPCDVDFFYDECAKYYPNLRFGERYKNETAFVLESHSEKITYCLSVMNDYFMTEYKNATCSNIDFPNQFAVAYSIDGGSFEGTKHEKFKVYFEDIDKKLICEPHLKFNTPDSSKSKRYNINLYCRIYFSMPSNKNAETIYIGAIIKHL